LVDETAVVEQLEAELERARVEPLCDVPADVVVMNSEFEYQDVVTGQCRKMRLVYPHEADSSTNRVSVLAPLGCALLGLRVGQQIDWHMPGGMRRIRVVAVIDRPGVAPE
ncbi:MAG TPA: nucleoside diphosphate kinase regulator, partial [Polyangiaceae bacterium]